ncbi:hypothetical protein C8R46DRAFT_1196409 [Mycena filopes]|nr:hypothetical protein C8R46DRAFT_1196409 [Mycena filopes]
MPDQDATDGYTSDTGPRDNPTLENFEKGTQVEVFFGEPPKNERTFNREGRAIVRKAHHCGQTITQICHVSRTGDRGVRRAIDNTYSPPDDLSKDHLFLPEEFNAMVSKKKSKNTAGSENSYSRAGSPSSLFSALSVSPAPGSDASYRPDGGNKRSASRESVAEGTHENAHHKKPRVEAGSSKATAGSQKMNVAPTEGQPHKTASSSSTAPNPAHNPAPPNPAPPNPAPPNPAPNPAPPIPHAPANLAEFRRNVMYADLSHHLPLLTDRGFDDMAFLRTMGTHWEDDHLRGMLRGLLTGTPEELKGRQALTDLQLWALELAIRRL